MTATSSTRPLAAGVEVSSFDWPAAFAGAVVATALSFVLLTFGTAIGLTTVSPWEGSGFSTKTVASLAAFWILVQQIASFMAGGYVAGRVRRRHEGSPQETDMRDALHGAVVWAVGIVIGAALATSALSSITGKAADAVGHGAQAAASSPAAEMAIDTMMRPPATAPAGGAAPATPGNDNASNAWREEVGRLLATSTARGGMSPADKTYLAQVISRRTGIPQAEAEARVNSAITSTKEAADTARKTALAAGFLTAAALLLSLAAAAWAAVKGGDHRDRGYFYAPPYRRGT